MVWLLGELGELIFKAIGGAHGYLERLDALGSMLVRFLAERPDAARVLLRELVNGGQSLDGRGREAIQNTMKITSAFLAEGMEAGAIARQDPRHLALSIAGLHLTYFAAAEVSSELLEGDVFSPELAEQRVQEVIGQVRRICGGEPS
jgi:AcrR family transcriptional regulator